MRIFSLFAVVLLMSCGTDLNFDDDFERSAHHAPDHSGGPPGSGGDGDDNDPPDPESCANNQDCADGLGCTQGGQCIDITGTTSVLNELQAEIDELPDAVGMGVPYKLPANAILRIDDDKQDGIGLFIDNGINLEGNGSRLLVENGMVGIRLQNGASWSSVKNLRIESQQQNSRHDGIGIDVRSHGVRLDNLMIRRMGTGVRAHTYANGDYANVNTQQWSRLVFWNCWDYGMHVRSGDSNAGLFSGIEILGGGGIQDDSFLGNTYIAPIIESQHEDAFNITSQASASTVLGLYVESSAADPTANSLRDLHIGGNAIRRLQTVGDRVGETSASLRFRNSHGMRMRIPGGPTEAFAFRHPNEEGEWRLKFTAAWNQWGISYEGSGIQPYKWTGDSHSQGTGRYELGTPME